MHRLLFIEIAFYLPILGVTLAVGMLRRAKQAATAKAA
jgi:uncharacterized membrane protein YqaE (UPF0057 family)